MRIIFLAIAILGVAISCQRKKMKTTQHSTSRIAPAPTTAGKKPTNLAKTLPSASRSLTASQMQPDQARGLVRQMPQAKKLSGLKIPEKSKRQRPRENPGSAAPPGMRQYQAAIALASAGKITKALALYLDSCSQGYIMGCHRYGYHMSQVGNWANAQRFYVVACSKGIAKSCNNLGWAFEQVGAFGEAKNYYSWGCIHHHKLACENFRRVHEKTLEKLAR